jgi:probable rRNA maturation factor
MSAKMQAAAVRTRNRKPGLRPVERPAEPAVAVQVATRAAVIPRGADLPGWVAAAGARGRGAVTVRLVGWPEGRRLNETFRGRTGPTNVLAFPAPGATTPAELGDLVICLPLVHREARQQGKKALHHLAHLVVHGTLHLLGLDHDHEAGARKMETAEVRILRRLGFPDPYRPVTLRPKAHRRT